MADREDDEIGDEDVGPREYRPPTAEDTKIVEEARRRWLKCQEAREEQAKRTLLAKQFRAGDQWPSAIKIARAGGNAIAGQPAMPPRPCLVVDRLSQPVRAVSNTIKNADFGFDVMPNGMGADTDTAEIFKGALRRVQNQSRGESPVEWAADGAIEGGFGVFRLRTEYVHDSWDGPEDAEEVFDQELRMERIANNLTWYCDPSANRPTRSDALYQFVTEEMERDAFKDKYPRANVASLDLFMSTGDNQGWVTKDTIRIAEYWRITYTTKEFKQGTRTRVMRTPHVEMFKINAVEVLERAKWVGSRIPLIPILGEELNVDGKVVLRGIIEPGQDAQRMVNYFYSGAVEIFALGSKKAPMIPAAGVANYKDVWQTRNIYNHSYLPYDVFDESGRPLPPPTLDTTESPIQAAVQLMVTSEEAIKATTSTGDASLGNSHPNERSGRALQSLQAASDLANSNYPDNVRRALIYAAEQMVEVLPKITRPGQVLHIMGLDDEPEQVMVGKPFTTGPNGVPQASPDDITPEIAKLSGGLHKFYDLKNGSYAVTVTVGKANATRREEGAAALGELIPHLPPEMAAVATPDYVEQLSFPGSHKIAEKLRKALPPQLQDQPEGAVPPQAQAMIQQLQQANQQLMQEKAMDTAKVQGSIQEAQIKAQADLQRAQLDAQLKIQIAQMDNAARIEVARIGAAKESVNLSAEAQEERLSTGLTLQHEAVQAAHDRTHDVNMAQLEHQHTLEQGQQSAAVAASQQGADQQHQAAMAQQAAEQAQAAQGGAEA